MSGMQLTLLHPELPDCAACIRWVHDERWSISTRGGKPVPRPAGTHPPCWKCPKKSPTSGLAFTARNRQAYMAYLKVKAGAPMPDDPIMHRNCMVLRFIEDTIARSHQATSINLASVIAGRKHG